MEWRLVCVGCSLRVDIVSLKLLSSITSTCVVKAHFLHVLWMGSEQTTRKTSPWKQVWKELVFAICSGHNISCSESCNSVAMADNVIEETENYLGKDELNWGYEEGKDSVREWLANSTLCETWNFIVIPMIRNYYKNNPRFFKYTDKNGCAFCGQ